MVHLCQVLPHREKICDVRAVMDAGFITLMQEDVLGSFPDAYINHCKANPNHMNDLSSAQFKLIKVNALKMVGFPKSALFITQFMRILGGTALYI